jgi:hypothetical protein
MTNSSNAVIMEIERKRKKQKRLRLLLLLIPIVLIISYFDWEKKKEDIRHGLTLSDRRALTSEYFEIEKVVHELAKTKFPLYETDSISLRSYMSLVDSLNSVRNGCLFDKFGVNDSIFALINLESFDAAWYDENGVKKDMYDEEIHTLWRYWEFKEPVCKLK